MRFVRLGITPEAGSTLYLPQIVGLPNALELALTGRIIDAQEALAKGLVSKVVPDAELMPAALALAEEIAFNPSEQVLAAKQMIHRHMVEQDIEHLLKYENRTFAKATAGPNHKEAIRAYVEKRQPQFHKA
jgi:enoyl-CoA hydratase/carnithine racemase